MGCDGETQWIDIKNISEDDFSKNICLNVDEIRHEAKLLKVDQNNNSAKNGKTEEVIDIDLTDPATEKAATKIQVFNQFFFYNFLTKKSIFDQNVNF